MNMNAKLQTLTGHTSAETAYVVNDYPYGFTLRCKIRYWLDYKQGRGFRFVSQTTNPKVEGAEFWNKPKAGTYSIGYAWMFLNADGHVRWDNVTAGTSPEGFARVLATYDFTPEQAEHINRLGSYVAVQRAKMEAAKL